jgi:hypothetical protein
MPSIKSLERRALAALLALAALAAAGCAPAQWAGPAHRSFVRPTADCSLLAREGSSALPADTLALTETASFDAPDLDRWLAAGWRPLVHLDRTDLDRDLELDDPGGFDAAIGAVFIVAADVSASYAPMEEEDTGRDVDCFWLDAGFGLGTAGPPGEAFQGLLHATIGPSLFVMEGEGGAPDMLGLGAFLRAGIGVTWQQVGLEVFGDLHGWLGGDSDDFQAAWAASLGVNLLVLF